MPVEGVDVVLSGPPPVKRRRAVTDRAGRFHFAGLPTGRYVVETSHLRYSTAVVEGLDLHPRASLEANLSVEPGSPGKLTITAQPRLDVQSAVSQRYLAVDEWADLPQQRSIAGLFHLLPELQRDHRPREPPDPSLPFALQGTSISETPFLLDGTDTSDVRTGAAVHPAPVELLRGVRVRYGAPAAGEGGALGGTVSLLTRAAGEAWNGAALLRWLQREAGRVFEAEAADSEAVDGGLWGGGPVAEERAWLFAGLMPLRGEVEDEEAELDFATARLDWRPTTDLLLNLGASLSRRQESASPLDSDVARLSLVLEGLPSSDLLLRAQLGHFEQDRTTDAGHEDQRRPQVSVSAAALLGSHDLTVGLQHASPVSSLSLPGSRSRAESSSVALYLQDRWRASERLTLDLGLRASRQRLRGDGLALDFDFDQRLAPRLGLAWDVRGDGQWRVYGSAGLLYDTLKHHLALTPLVDGADVDPDLDPERSFVASVGTDHQLLPNLVVGAAISFRELQQVVQLMELDPALSAGEPTPAFSAVVNPGSGLARFPYGPSLPPHPGLDRRYLGLALRADLRFSRWLASLAYGYTRLRGNHDGLANADDPGRPPAPNAAESCRLLEGCFTAGGAPDDGPLSLDRPHQIELYGAYRFAFGLTVGALGRFQSGTPFERHVPLLVDGDEVRLFKPEGRGSGDRLPSLQQLDLRLQYALPVGASTGRLTLIADLLNLLDRQASLLDWPQAYLEPVSVGRRDFFAGFEPDRAAAEQGILPDPRLGRSWLRQPGLGLRLGLRWEW